MNIKTIVLVTIVTLVFCQCTKESQNYSATELNVYFDLFEQEAALRGLDIDLSAMGVTGQIVKISDDHVAGRCKYSDRNPAMVMVDKSFWNKSNDVLKEYVIFHELGHCILNRTHRDESLVSGACISVMASNNRVCANAYGPETRKEYLDELFFYPE